MDTIYSRKSIYRTKIRCYQKIAVFFLLSFWIILSTYINSYYCWGATISSNPPIFSLNIKNEPLKKVIEKISEATGYQIAIDEKWLGLLVTASLKDVSVHESMRGILKNINRIIISNDKEKKLSIIIYGSIEPDKSQKKIYPLDLEVIPPKNPGERGVTQRALNAMRGSEPKIDPLDLEVIPPKNPGERGVTQRALNAMKASEPKIDPLDLEVIQPKNPGERGVTQRALNAMRASEPKIDPLDLEVI